MTYILWEFNVHPDRLDEFEKIYRSDGRWAQLFHRDSAYRETILVKDHEQSGRYLTIDVWEDREAYLRFKDRFADDYRKIDQDCETLTSGEREIGIFEQI